MTASPMVEQVNRLIAARLAGDGELFLPGVGSLWTERHGARRLSKRRVLPPIRVVEFSSHERGESLVVLIARAAQCPEAQAQEIYDRYLTRTQQDGTLTVEGVGVLRDKHFTPSEAFGRTLNPRGDKPLRIRDTRVDWVMWVGICAILFVVLSPGVIWWMDYQGYRPQFTQEEPASFEKATPEGSADPVETSPVEPGTTGLSDPQGVQTPISGQADAPVAAGTTGGTAPQTGSGTTGGTTGTALQTTSGTTGGTAPQTTSGTTGGTTGTAPQTTSGTTSDPLSDVPARMTSGRCYVVLGVFSTVANAQRAAAEAVRRDTAMACTIYRFGEKFLVSPYASADAAACTRFIREAGDKFPGMWPYTAK